MLFIIGQIAYQSKAGLFGTFVLFLVLAFGMRGFVVKLVIQWLLDVRGLHVTLGIQAQE